MAIHRLLQKSAFDPEEIKAITRAYEDTLRNLGVANRSGRVAQDVAKKIMEIARTGERDSVRMRAQAIAELSMPQAN